MSFDNLQRAPGGPDTWLAVSQNTALVIAQTGSGTGASGITSAAAQSLDLLARSTGTFRKTTNVEPTAAEWPQANDGDVATVITPDDAQHIYEYAAGAWSNTQSITASGGGVPVAAAGESVGPGDVVYIGNRIYANNTAAAIVIPTPATDAALQAAGLTDTSDPVDQSLWLEVTADPTGTAAPAGKYFAIDENTGAEYDVDFATGNWQPRIDAPSGLPIRVAGETVAPNAVVVIGGRPYANNTTAPIVVPTPATDAAIEAAGFRDIADAPVEQILIEVDETTAPIPAATEDPTDAEVLAQVIAQGAKAGDIVRYDTPLDYSIFYDVYTNGGGTLSLLRNETDLREFPLNPPNPVNFRASTTATAFDGSVVGVYEGGDALVQYIVNQAGAWSPYRTIVATGGGSATGGGETLNETLTLGNTTNQPIEFIDTSTGIIGVSPNGSRWLSQFNDAGELVTVAL